MNHHIEPAGIAPPAANYAHAVLSEAAARLLHTAGVVPVRPDGSVPTDLADQAAGVWANIGAILAAADMRPTDIVSMTTYVVAGEPFGPVMAGARSFRWADRSPPRRSSRCPRSPDRSGASRSRWSAAR